jgi:hypothetical protein
MKAYGCLAYAKNHKLLKQKVAERALVGYLVGYNASNIYTRIQIYTITRRKVEVDHMGKHVAGCYDQITIY